MIEKFLVLSYFDMHIGPNILYSNTDISNIKFIHMVNL